MGVKAFYHSSDFDGHCSGAIIKRVYPDAILYPINYGTEFPFGDIKKDNIWLFSLYTNKDDVDCSIIAKKYGGGGHKKASGFSSSTIPFDI